MSSIPSGHGSAPLIIGRTTALGDRGALAFEDGILVERGIDAPYVEHWSRTAGGEATGARIARDGNRDVRTVLSWPAKPSFTRAAAPTRCPWRHILLNWFDGAASRQAAQDLFDCEISFGRRHGSDWRIDRSTHCFREGATLAPAFDSVAGSLVIDDVAPDGTPIKRTWRVIAHEGTSPLSRWFGSDGANVMPLPSQRTQNRTIKTFGAAR